MALNTKKRCKVSEDRISTLPDAVIGLILSFLPTKCAVKTSILSTRWRYVHRFTASLSFDIPFKLRQNKKRLFKEFVQKTLLTHQLPCIDRFRLNCDGFKYHSQKFYKWICFATLRGAKEIDVKFNSIDCNLAALPISLFMCRTIVVLKLHSRIRHLKVPDTVSLPNLDVMHLSNIQFEDSGSIQRLISSCLVLKELRLDICGWPTYNQVCVSLTKLEKLTLIECTGYIEFDAANLTLLELICSRSVSTNFSLEDASSLAKAKLRIPSPDALNNTAYSVAYRQRALTLLNLCSYNASELHLMNNSLELLVEAGDDYIPTCPNLVKLHLGCCSYKDWKYITYMLAYSPKLKTVIFTEDLILNENSPDNVALEPFSCRVKVIKVSQCSGSKPVISILKHLLKNCKVLKKLILKTPFGMTMEEELELSKKILMLQMASKRCSIKII